MSSAKRRKEDEDSSAADSSDDDQPSGAEGGGSDAAAGARGDGDRLEQLKREKRLAMNRESARARRRRKKIRLETLEKQAEEMNKRHQELTMQNQQLKTRVAQLEAELAKVGSNRAAPGVNAGGMDTSMLLGAGGNLTASAGLRGTGGQDFSSLAGLGLSSEQRAALQQQAAMARMGGGAGSSALASLGLSGMDPEMQYLQLQQQLMASRGTDGAAGDTATRLLALEELQRRHQLVGLNQPQQGLGRSDDLSRIRGAEGFGGASYFGRSHADAQQLANMLRNQQQQQPGSQPGGVTGARDIKTELYERLANTNKKS